MLSEATIIVAGYHAYGFWIQAVSETGSVLQREKAGYGAIDDSVTVPLVGEVLSLKEIQTQAIVRARKLGQQLGLADDAISVFHDEDAEFDVRISLGTAH